MDSAWIEPLSMGSPLAQWVLSYFCLLIRNLRQALQDCSVHGTTQGDLCKELPRCLEDVLWHLASILFYVWVSSRTEVSNTYFWSAQPVFQAVLGRQLQQRLTFSVRERVKTHSKGNLILRRYKTFNHSLSRLGTGVHTRVPFRWTHWHQQNVKSTLE